MTSHDAYGTRDQQLGREPRRALESARGVIILAACRSGARLAARVVRSYAEILDGVGLERGDLTHMESIDCSFSDTEPAVRLELDVSGGDVFLMQGL